MATISGQVLSAMERAERVLLLEAQAPPAPGWYVLQRGEHGPLLCVGQAPDLAARLATQRARIGRHLADFRDVDLLHVTARWVTAEPLVGAKAYARSFRAAIETVLIALLQPEWTAEEATPTEEHVLIEGSDRP